MPKEVIDRRKEYERNSVLWAAERACAVLEGGNVVVKASNDVLQAYRARRSKGNAPGQPVNSAPMSAEVNEAEVIIDPATTALNAGRLLMPEAEA